MESSKEGKDVCIDDKKFRRRSLNRRSSILVQRPESYDEDQINAYETEQLEHNTNNKHNEKTNEPFSLSTYVENLKKEKEAWRAMLKKRKTQVRHLSNLKEKLEVNGQDFNLDILSKCDRDFLQKRPKYEQFCQDVEKLINVTTKAIALKQQINQYDKKLVLLLNTDINDATQQIIQMTK